MLIPDSPSSHCLPGPSVNYIVYLLADITSHAPIPPNRNFSHVSHCSLPSLIPGWTSLYLPFLYNLFPHQGTLEIQAKSGHCLNPERLPTILRIKVRATLLIHEAWSTNPIPVPAPASPALPLFTCFIFTALFDVSTAHKICYHSRALSAC